MHYEVLGDPYFREHEVPRMTTLATAKPDGEFGVPVELLKYEARSRPRRRNEARTSGTRERRVSVRAASCGVKTPSRTA